MDGPQSSTCFSLVLLLPLLLLQGPTWCTAAQRCPRICVCDNSRQRVACRHQNVTEVPDTIPELTQRLDLQGNMLKVIPPAAFQALPHLTHLDLRRCQVELVAEGAFRGLGRLLLLNLASNRLSTLPQEALDGLGSLQRLELEGNLLEELRPGTFGALGALATLNLAHNALVYLPAMVFQGLLQVHWLQLSHNALSVLAPEALAGLPALRRLSLHHNELQALPGPALSQAQGLARLQLGHNPLTYVGEEDGLVLPSLRELLLDHGALQALGPRAFAHCPRLRTLDLRGNQLETLPPLQGPGQLRRLRCRGNPLWVWAARAPAAALKWVGAGTLCGQNGAMQGDPGGSPGEASGTPLRPLGPCAAWEMALEEEEEEVGGRPAPPCPTRLHLALPHSGNSSCEEPRPCVLRLATGDLAGVRALRWLYLSGNRITQVSPGALGPAQELEKLHLDRNQLREVPTRALEGLPALVELQLSGNPLRALHDGAFQPVARSLQLLFLNGSSLEQVSPGAFAGLGPGLQSLHLQENQLQALPALPALTGLGLIDLSGNPFRCDCQLLPLHRWLARLNLRVGATCAAPPTARGQRVKVAVAAFEACPGWAARKAKRTPAFLPSARRPPTKRRHRTAHELLHLGGGPRLPTQAEGEQVLPQTPDLEPALRTTATLICADTRGTHFLPAIVLSSSIRALCTCPGELLRTQSWVKSGSSNESAFR
nr:LOW QUALITY PROTEIN: chondroadherin-like protein [Loxodonta africana]